MKPWTAWVARLGLAGSCLVWAGCGGGGDVPDPDSDSNAASGAAPSGGAAPPAAAEADAAPAEPAPTAVAAAAAPAPGSPAPASDAKPGQEATAAATPEGGAPASEGDGSVAGTKSEGTSATAELLAVANGPAQAPSEGDKPAEEAPAAAGPGAAPAGAIGYPGMGGQRGAGSAYAGAPGAPGIAASGSGIPSGYPGMAGGAAAQGQGQRGYPGAGGAGMPGAPGGFGAGGAAGAPADFREPIGAVTAFLAAVAAKDPEKLDEATALRAGTATETSAAYTKLFLSIRERSLSSDELDELARKVEGMTITGTNQAKSSGRLGVIVTRTDAKGDTYIRTITVRKEKAGWKVIDIGPQRVIDRPSMRGRGR